MVNRSSSGTCAVCDQRTVPEGTSISCTATRTAFAACSKVPVIAASTPSSEASARRSSAPSAKRAAARLDRTVSESSADNDTVIASGRLNARKSTSGSGRSTRNGSTTSRLVARAFTTSPASPRDIEARRSVAMSSADGYRSSRALATARWMIRSRSITAGDPISAGGCSCTTACRMSTAEVPPNAARPLSIS